MLKGFLSNPRASLGFTPIVRPFLSIQFTPYTKSSTKFALFPLNIHRQYASRNRRNPIELTYSEEMSASKRKRQPVIQPPSPISTIASQVTQNDPDILDAEEALMASPSASNDLALSEEFQVESNGSSSGFSDAPDSDQEDLELVDRKIQKKPGKAVKKVTPKKPTKQARLKKNDEDEEPSSEDEIAEALQRPPAVNHEYEPIPWKGRIGYVCVFDKFHYELVNMFRIQLRLTLNFTGLSKYISSRLQTAYLLLKDLSYCNYSRTRQARW